MREEWTYISLTHLQVICVILIGQQLCLLSPVRQNSLAQVNGQSFLSQNPPGQAAAPQSLSQTPPGAPSGPPYPGLQVGEWGAGELRPIRAGAPRRRVLEAEFRGLSLLGAGRDRTEGVRTGSRVEEERVEVVGAGG